jgi:hypothetical protein
MDDMMLVFTELEPNLRTLNDGRFHVFAPTRLGYSEDTTGFKKSFRELSPQVRHATGSIQASLSAGSVGYLLAQLTEWLSSNPSAADYRLNRSCFSIAEGMLNAQPGWTTREIGVALRRELGDPAQTGPWTGPPDGLP